MTFLKGLSQSGLAGRALALKAALGAAFLGLAVTVPVAQGPLASVAQAKAKGFPSYCGRLGQQPCKIWQHTKACKKGLVQRPFGKKCAKPKPKKPIKLPTILPKPEQVAGCGARGEKPCTVNKAFPSCEGRLAEDFIKNICRTEDSALARKASNAFRELKPLITTIGKGAVNCGVDTVMRRASKRSRRQTAEMLLGMPCFEALLAEARRNGYRTLAVGGSGGASIGIGAEGENGFAFDTSGNRQVRTYHTLSLKFLSIGAGTAVNIGLYKAPPSSIAGDAHGASVGVAFLGGGGAAVWYNYGSDAVAGLTAVITAGGKADLAYVRNTTKTVDAFRVPPRRVVSNPPVKKPAPPPPPAPVRRPKPEFGWSGLPVDGNYRGAKDAGNLTRYFLTSGDKNQTLWYRYKQGNGAWSKWRKFGLYESGRNYHQYREANGSGQSFILWDRGQRIEYRANPRRDSYRFTLEFERYLGRYCDGQICPRSAWGPGSGAR